MFNFLCKTGSPRSRTARSRKLSPVTEGLEDRLLLYAAVGGQWAFGSRITYSFVPDGTSIGGTPSVLFQSLNAKYSTATWEAQFQRAAAVWQAVANINLAQVDDDGSRLGVNGNQQDDPRFGDIRISAIPQSGGTLASALLPPPINGGTDAGDIILNSKVNWQINSTYDIQTVAIHEFGHALGMGHSQITAAVMYASYTGLKQSLTTDDVSGLKSLYGPREYDQFNSNGQNNGLYYRAASLNSFIDANSQVAVANLDLTKAGQAEWFYVTVPSSSTGTMVATVQSSDLSSLSPRVTVYTAGLSLVGDVTSTAFGATVSISVAGVSPGQGFYVRAGGMSGGTTVGGFGLLLNFGSQDQPPIQPPDTTVPEQPDHGGGSMLLAGGQNRFQTIKIGSHTGWGDVLSVDSKYRPGSPSTQLTEQTQLLGNLFGLGSLSSSSIQVNVSLNFVANSRLIQPSAVASAPVGLPPELLEVLDSVLDQWKPRELKAFLFES